MLNHNRMLNSELRNSKPTLHKKRMSSRYKTFIETHFRYDNEKLEKNIPEKSAVRASLK
jgi:hypothetical protein